MGIVRTWGIITLGERRSRIMRRGTLKTIPVQTNGYYWNSYKWCNGDNYKLTRYCPMEKTGDWDGSGKPDNKTELRDYDYADDVARAVLKGKWRLPTRAEWAALRKQCTWNWINVNNVLGYQVIAENGNSIFILAAGFRQDDVLREIGDSSNYWSMVSVH